MLNLLAAAFVAWAVYRIGYVRGWVAGFKEGDAMGFRFGRCHGRIDALNGADEPSLIQDAVKQEGGPR